MNTQRKGHEIFTLSPTEKISRQEAQVTPPMEFVNLLFNGNDLKGFDIFRESLPALDQKLVKVEEIVALAATKLEEHTESLIRFYQGKNRNIDPVSLEAQMIVYQAILADACKRSKVLERVIRLREKLQGVG